MPNHWSDQHISDCWPLRGSGSSVQSHLAEPHTWYRILEGRRYTRAGIDVLYDAAQYFFPQYGVRTKWTLGLWSGTKKSPLLVHLEKTCRDVISLRKADI